MEIRTNIAKNLNNLMRESGRSLAELSREWDIPLSSMKTYANGSANLRADTIELLAAHVGMPPAELISCLPDGWAQAKIVLQASRLFGGLSSDRRSEGITLFLQLTALFSGVRQDGRQDS